MKGYQLSRWLNTLGSLTLSTSMAFCWAAGINFAPQSAHAVSANMLLLWDGGSAPTGWSILTTYDGKFIRGDSVANVLSTGGNANHTPTVSSVTVAAPSAESATGGIITSARSPSGHTHTVGATTADNKPTLPAYRNLAIIKYTGIPEFIPSGAIGMFDTAPGIPGSGWTQYTAQNGKMIRLDSANIGATGGSDTHTHTTTWGALGAASGSANIGTLGGNVATATNHTHTITATTTTDAMSGFQGVPPFVEPLLAKANADTASIPAGMISMFDGDPGSGWSKLSESGGVFNQQFLRPNTGNTYNGSSQGNTTYTHTNSQTTGAAAATSGQGGGTGMAANGHTHLLTANYASESTIPQYEAFVVAKRMGFTQSNYYWYVDSGVENVTNKWGNPDIAQNTSIDSIPASNNPPSPQDTLRLRMNFTLSGFNIAASVVQFKLQYKQGTDSSCTTGTWVDVGAGGSGAIWRYSTSTITDGTTLSASQLSPSSSVKETYIKSSAATANPNAVTVSQTMEYDFHIEHNGAVSASQYSFRAVDLNATPFVGYSVCPTLVTAPTAGGGNFLRHGEFFRDNVRSQGFFW